MNNYAEFCKEQADKLFAIIDQHQGLMQWQKTWSVKGNISLPKGVGGFYRGINLWTLLAEQIYLGYGSSIWLTYNQIKQKGAHVLKGAKGSKVCFFKLREVEQEEMSEEDDLKVVPLFRAYTVFNLDQTSLVGQMEEPVSQDQLDELLSVLDVSISEFGNQPHFQPAQDVIVMPRREFFNSSADYNITLLHELVHWSGHPSRLDRQTIRDYGKSDAIRAEEELIAEIGSVFLAAHFGIVGDLLNHASYVTSWKQHLDAKAVGRAMSQASKAFGWLISQLETKQIEAAA